jgi:hypothetical protein
MEGLCCRDAAMYIQECIYTDFLLDIHTEIFLTYSAKKVRIYAYLGTI